MDCVVNVVKVMGKWCLSYQGSEFEDAYTLEDRSVDYGNFLEMIMLLSVYDPCLQQHLTECIEKVKNNVMLGQEAEVHWPLCFEKIQSTSLSK